MSMWFAWYVQSSPCRVEYTAAEFSFIFWWTGNSSRFQCACDDAFYMWLINYLEVNMLLYASYFVIGFNKCPFSLLRQRYMGASYCIAGYLQSSGAKVVSLFSLCRWISFFWDGLLVWGQKARRSRERFRSWPRERFLCWTLGPCHLVLEFLLWRMIWQNYNLLLQSAPARVRRLHWVAEWRSTGVSLGGVWFKLELPSKSHPAPSECF